MKCACARTQAESKDYGLSQGDEGAGASLVLGVGIGAAIVGLVVCAACLMWQRRRKRSRSERRNRYRCRTGVTEDGRPLSASAPITPSLQTKDNIDDENQTMSTDDSESTSPVSSDPQRQRAQVPGPVELGRTRIEADKAYADRVRAIKERIRQSRRSQSKTYPMEVLSQSTAFYTSPLLVSTVYGTRDATADVPPPLPRPPPPRHSATPSANPAGLPPPSSSSPAQVVQLKHIRTDLASSSSHHGGLGRAPRLSSTRLGSSGCRDESAATVDTPRSHLGEHDFSDLLLSLRREEAGSPCPSSRTSSSRASNRRRSGITEAPPTRLRHTRSRALPPSSGGGSSPLGTSISTGAIQEQVVIPLDEHEPQTPESAGREELTTAVASGGAEDAGWFRSRCTSTCVESGSLGAQDSAQFSEDAEHAVHETEYVYLSV